MLICVQHCIRFKQRGQSNCKALSCATRGLNRRWLLLSVYGPHQKQCLKHHKVGSSDALRMPVYQPRPQIP